MLKNIFRLGLLLILLCGCRDEFIYTLPTEQEFQFNIISRLTPNNVVAIRLSENVSIGSTLENIDRQDAIITFEGRDVPGGELAMAFNTTSEKYHLVREDFRVKEDSQYEIAIVFPSEKKDTIRAQAHIPGAVNFSAEFVSSTKIPIDTEYSHHEIEILITFQRADNQTGIL